MSNITATIANRKPHTYWVFVLEHAQIFRHIRQMSRELFNIDGKRKYLTQDEQERFLKAASDLDRADVRTLCMTLAIRVAEFQRR